MSVSQNQYYAALVSIVFVAGATSSMMLGISLAAFLVIFYALFIPVGIIIKQHGIVIRRWLRKTTVKKNEIKLLLSGNEGKRVLQVRFENGKRFRQIQLNVVNENELAQQLTMFGYNLEVDA